MSWPRWCHWLYAQVMGYFWRPCPLCGQYSGGHEWAAAGSPCVYQDGDGYPKYGKGVCHRPECIAEADRLNREIAMRGGWWYPKKWGPPPKGHSLHGREVGFAGLVMTKGNVKP